MPYKPGQSGNISGRPKDYAGITELARSFGPVTDDELIRIAAEAGLKLDPPTPRPTAQDAPASVGGNVGTDQSPPLGPNDIN